MAALFIDLDGTALKHDTNEWFSCQLAGEEFKWR
jgi:hypothetical protein